MENKGEMTMRTALALVAVLGLMGAGVAVSTPPRTGKVTVKPQAVASLSPGTPKASANYIYPIGGTTPRGWIVQSPTGGMFIPRVMALGTTLKSDGTVDRLVEVDLDHGIPGGLTMHGAAYSGFGGGTHPIAGIKVRVNGPSEVHLPGRSGFGTGPSTPAGSFTLSGGITVTAIP